MDRFKTVDEALDFAISEEEGAFNFYTGLAERAKKTALKDLMLQFAREEKGHKTKLLVVKSGKKLISATRKVTDLRISDYLVDAEPNPDLSYQDALIVAMKKEKAAFTMYTNLAATTPELDIQELFLGLAQEEANHKLRFEIEYDQEVMREN